ncbi:MAG: outer membrane lipoprotein LolB [Rhodoferax sp.]
MNPVLRGPSRWLAGWMVLALVACATPPAPPTAAPRNADLLSWSGRLALNIASTPPQSISAGFELKVQPPTKGELHFLSPLGTTLATLQWTPGQALLQQGDKRWEDSSPDALLTRLTGAALPMAALIDWLQARPTEVKGWQADMSQMSSGKLRVQSTDDGMPRVTLRLIVEP